jgi:hypothetical protein
MAWTQVRGFNQNIATKIKNLCLGNVQSGFGIPGKYNSAWEAWQNTQQHTGPIPTGVDVPVFFSYSATIDGINKNWGHIGVRLANGTFWSDGTIYPSIQAYTSTHLPKYVGWGESVNNVQVIKQEITMEKPQEGDAKNIYPVLYEAPANPGQIAYMTSKTWKDWAYGEIGGYYRVYVKPLREAAKQLPIEQSKVKQLTVTNAQLVEANKTLTTENATLKAQLAIQSDDTQLLNGFGTWLQKLIVRLGLKG